jgi:hypothetical protein
MLRAVKWLGYRDRVLDGVNTLLVMYPRGRQFADDYPGLGAVIRSHFDAGVSPMGAALHVSLTILRDLLGQLRPDERLRVLEALQPLRLEDIEPLAARQISRRPEMPTDRTGFAVRLIGGALLMARGLTHEGALGRSEHAALLAGLDEALMTEPCPQDEAARALRIPSDLFGIDRSA